MKLFLKNFIPPIALMLLRDTRIYKEFIQYKYLTKRNGLFKNVHKGKRCFILGSGPSIKKQNLLPLKNEIVFGLNNFFVHEDFEEIFSGDKPKYYVTAPIHPPQTENEWLDWFTEMEKSVPQNVKMFFGLNNYKKNCLHIFRKHNLFQKHSLYWYFSGKNYNETKSIKHGMDLRGVIFSGEAVSVYAIMIAIYMGFDEIYLLGMDHDYFLYESEKDMRMYSDAKHQKNEIKRTFGEDFYIQEFLRQYQIFMKYQGFAKTTKSKIFNASAGGILKVFPRVSFSELFK